MIAPETPRKRGGRMRAGGGGVLGAWALRGRCTCAVAREAGWAMVQITDKKGIQHTPNANYLDVNTFAIRLAITVSSNTDIRSDMVCLG